MEDVNEKIKEEINKVYDAIKAMESYAETEEEIQKINEYKIMIDKTEELVNKIYNKKQEQKQEPIKNKKEEYNFSININDLDKSNDNTYLENKSVSDRIIYEGRIYELLEEDINYYAEDDIKECIKNFLEEFEDDYDYNKIKFSLKKHLGNKLVD